MGQSRSSSPFTSTPPVSEASSTSFVTAHADPPSQDIDAHPSLLPLGTSEFRCVIYFFSSSPPDRVFPLDHSEGHPYLFWSSPVDQTFLPKLVGPSRLAEPPFFSFIAARRNIQPPPLDDCSLYIPFSVQVVHLARLTFYAASPFPSS